MLMGTFRLVPATRRRSADKTPTESHPQYTTCLPAYLVGTRSRFPTGVRNLGRSDAQVATFADRDPCNGTVQVSAPVTGLQANHDAILPAAADVGCGSGHNTYVPT